MRATFDQHIGIFEDAVPKEWCENVINLFENNSYKSHNRQESEKGTPPTDKDDFHLSLSLINFSLCKEFSLNFFKNLYPLYSHHYKIDAVLTPPFYLTDYKIQKTLPRGGYHVWHVENTGLKPVLNRFMAYTLYLNNVEEGGETEFLIQSKRVSPKQGTLSIFPAYYTHIHRGNPPLSGEKYIMTGWIEFSSR